VDHPDVFFKRRNPITENSARVQAPTKKTASQGNKTRLRHFAFKVREMVKKLWSLIGVTFCRHTRFRCFGSISAGGSFATLHLSKKTVYPSKHGSGSVVLYRFRRSLTK
jgi:hypothetical protein